MNKEQAYALAKMKELLDQTINVKIKYEKIINKLVSEPDSRNKAIEIIKDYEQCKEDLTQSEPQTQSEKIQ